MINDYLIFSNERCDFNRKVKNTSVIKFYNNLNLRNFVSPYVNKEKLTYKLKATLNHIGELNKGHYYCNINLGNEWFIFNDSVVEKNYLMEYESDSICLLLYEKIRG